jgi:hypothetical protein
LKVANLPSNLENLCGVGGCQLAFQFRICLRGWWSPTCLSILNMFTGSSVTNQPFNLKLL